MKHMLGRRFVVWEEDEDDDDVFACDYVDDVETVCVKTEN